MIQQHVHRYPYIPRFPMSLAQECIVVHLTLFSIARHITVARPVYFFSLLSYSQQSHGMITMLSASILPSVIEAESLVQIFVSSKVRG